MHPRWHVKGGSEHLEEAHEGGSDLLLALQPKRQHLRRECQHSSFAQRRSLLEPHLLQQPHHLQETITRNSKPTEHIACLVFTVLATCTLSPNAHEC